MSTLLEIDVGQMRLLAGRRSTTSAVGRFAAPRKRGQRIGVLYVLAAVKDDPDEVLAQTIIQVVGKAYQSAQGSLTSRLIRAVRAGSAALLQDNLDLVSRSPRNGGVACAVLRHQDAYLAQAGAAFACACQRGALIHQLQAAPGTDTAQAFGRRRDPDVHLAYHTLKPGDSVLLAGASLIQELDQKTLIKALGFADAALSLDNLTEALPAGDGPALVLAMRGRGAPAPRLERRSFEPRPRPVPEAPVEEEIEPPRPAEPEPALKDRLETVQKGTRRALAAVGRVAGDWLQRLMPGGKGPYRGERRPTGRKLRRQISPEDNHLWRWVALILPVVITLVVIGTYWKRGLDRQTRYDELMTRVNKELETASTADEPTARLALESALSALNETDESLAEGDEIPRLRTRVQEQLDTLNKIERIYQVEKLHTYPTAGTVDQIIVHGADIYVLDRLTDRVYHHRLDESGASLESDEEKLLVRKGDSSGDATVVGELVGMVWMPGGKGRQTGALFILGRNGQLLIHDPTWDRLVGTMLPASETWQYPVTVSGYRGNFYILDPGLRQVLRYRTSGSGYSSPPESYFTKDKPGMNSAIDMAIDGFVYILFEDGRLEKYLSGEPVSLTLDQTDKPVQQPSAIYAAPDEEAQFLYLADPAAGRVLRCDKEGHLIQQFVIEGSDALEQVQDIFVDEVGSKLYFLSNNQLFMLTIPPS